MMMNGWIMVLHNSTIFHSYIDDAGVIMKHFVQ